MTKKTIKKVTTVTTEEFIDEPSNEKTQIICILDRSGSMTKDGIIYEAINGFNNFLEEQKKLKDKATLTVALFDDRYDLLYDGIDIKTVQKITYDTWTPRGMTALYDAIGKTINTAKSKHSLLGSERPNKVLVCIVTDGLENASHEYNHGSIVNLIKRCEEDNWNFIYLAANQNAFAIGTSFGISGGNTYTFTADAQGAFVMSNTLNNATVSYRGMSSTDKDYKTKSKHLINSPDDKKEPEDNGSGTITSGGINSTGSAGGSFSVQN
jgi:uncharacterized protein YegL